MFAIIKIVYSIIYCHPSNQLHMTSAPEILKSNNLGTFYRFVNIKLSDRSGIAPLINYQGVLITSDSERADLLNAYFESVLTQDNGITPNFSSRLPINDPRFGADSPPTNLYQVSVPRHRDPSTGEQVSPDVQFQESETLEPTITYAIFDLRMSLYIDNIYTDVLYIDQLYYIVLLFC